MRYARIQDGQPVEIIEPFFDEDGNEVPIDERFVPELVATMIEWQEP